MSLCLLSITFACPYRNPTATMDHTIHNAEDSKPLNRHLPWTVETGIHLWREHLSIVLDTIEWEHLPTQVGYPNENDEQLSFAETVPHLGGEHAGCGGPGLVWSHCLYSEVLWNAYGRGMNIQCKGSCSGGHSCSHLWGGMDSLEVLTNTDLDKSVNSIWEKLVYCRCRKSFVSLSSPHKNESQSKCFGQ